MKIRLLSWATAIGIFLASCIDQVQLATGGHSGALVVQGLITNEVGPVMVRISRALPFDSESLVTTYYVPEIGATVSVMDDDGETLLFKESAPGVYVSVDTLFQGQVGRSYILHCRTQDGREYESDPEVMLAGPEIAGIKAEYTRHQRFSSTGSVVNDEFFDIFVSADDPPGERNFYRWEVSGIMEYYSLTENPMIFTCWANFPDLENGIQIAHDRFFNGNRFSQRIASVPYQKPTRYMVKVEQYTLTAEAHTFWDLVNKQKRNTGSIFDPLPAVLSGNIYNKENPEDVVLGYFGASSISRSYLLFDQFKVSAFKAPSRATPALEGDCREHPPFGDIIRPDGF